jgi:hypothetical protein
MSTDEHNIKLQHVRNLFCHIGNIKTFNILNNIFHI